jgi:nucleotide-binding universal stress UspA family protein
MLTYIAAYDGSDASRAAVELAVRMARAERAQVIAAHVYPLVTVPVARPGFPVVDQIMQDDVRAAAEVVLDGLDVAGVARKVLIPGSPAQALHELAEREHAALIAVGVTHHEHLGRLVPGSVGAKLLHGAPCPVVAVPAGPSGAIETIGVAYDGGTEAGRALEAALDLAQRLGARLLLIGSVEMPIFAEPALATAWDVQPEVRDALERDLRETAAGLGVEADVRVLTGPAGPMIAEAAADVDLLVTGSRGYGPVRSVLVGGVSRHLVDHAPCPVLVVPRAETAEVGPAAARAAS